MVGPANLKPRFLSSLLMIRDSSVCGGMSDMAVKAWSIGFPWTNCQMNLPKEPNSFWIWMNLAALLMVASIFVLLRMTFGFLRMFSASAVVYFAVVLGSKLAKAFLRTSLRLRISSQVKPA